MVHAVSHPRRAFLVMSDIFFLGEKFGAYGYKRYNLTDKFMENSSFNNIFIGGLLKTLNSKYMTNNNIQKLCPPG